MPKPKPQPSAAELETMPMLQAAAQAASADSAMIAAAPSSSNRTGGAPEQLVDSGGGLDPSPTRKKSKKSKRSKSAAAAGDAAATAGRVISGGTGAYDAEGLEAGTAQATRASTSGRGSPTWKYIMYGLVIGPWKFVRGLGWCLNRWQRLCRPLSALVYTLSDKGDKHMPTIHAACVWLWSQVSLMLHFVSVILTFAVANLMFDHGRGGIGFAIVILYLISHYLMGVIMYMEMDRITRSGRYTASEFVTFVQRVFEALFWDLQLFVSLVHSNCMLEGLTQMLLKGFEEARVCIHFLVNTLPMCVMLAVLYEGVAGAWIALPDIDALQKRGYEDTIWIAFVFSVLNALEKLVRVSLADPWLHPDLDDCFPLAFMRSNAARLPRGLLLEFLFSFNCKGDARELCDGHKAYLLRKALRTFNGSSRISSKAEIIAQRLDKSKFRNPRSICALDASDIHPGRHMSDMLAEVLGDSVGYVALNLANNALGPHAIAHIVDALRANRLLQLRVLILAGNRVGEQGCQAVARYLSDSRSITQLTLARNPLGDAGVKQLAEALSYNKSLVKLDLSDCEVGEGSGTHVAGLVKNNNTLQELCLRGVKLGAAGFESIAKALRTNTGLQSLDLGATGAGDSAAVAFAQAFASNHTLTRLDLSHTCVSDEGAKALCDAMQYNSTLEVCQLSGTLADKSWTKLMDNIVSGRQGQRTAER